MSSTEAIAARQTIERQNLDLEDQYNEQLEIISGDPDNEDAKSKALHIRKSQNTNRQMLATMEPHPAPEIDDGDPPDDLLHLRKAVSVTEIFEAARSKRGLTGAARELNDHLGLEDNEIDLGLWDAHRSGLQTRAAGTPSNVGRNLDTLQPEVFAPSIADKLMIEMPVVESGVYATATITTSATADLVAPGAAAAETDIAFTDATTEPHRLSCSVTRRRESIAKVGAANYDSLILQNVSHVISSEYDNMLINGDIATDSHEIEGILKRLTNDASTSAAVFDFDGFLAKFTGGIDGKWATTLSEVSIVAGVDTYKLSAAKVS